MEVVFVLAGNSFFICVHLMSHWDIPTQNQIGDILKNSNVAGKT